jgi:hypothetical protein
MPLFEHQQKIINEDPKITGLFLGTGSGKTLTALCLARGKTLVICPKTQKEDRNWERENEQNNLKVKLTVISKEYFRDHWGELEQYDTIINDEAHTCLGVTPETRQVNKKPVKKTSQLFGNLQLYMKKYPPIRLYLCTATIMRSPMTVWGAATILGYDWNWYEFRDTFYFKIPSPGYREIWIARSDDATKDRLARAVRTIGYVGRLEDFFDVPPQTYKTIYLELTSAQKKKIKELKIEYPEPIVRVGKIHQLENGVLTGDEFSKGESYENAKIDTIHDLAIEFPRMVIFAKYRAQIDAIASSLSEKKYKVLTLTGDTKERGEVIKEANKSKECIFIAQAQISAGWELPEYPVMIFASRTYSFVDYDQSIGRIQRANNIKKNLYITLVTRGGVDEAVDKCLANKKDFSDRIYTNELE